MTNAETDAVARSLRSAPNGPTFEPQQQVPPDVRSARGRSTEALASGFVPGVGQLLQGRRLAAAIQFTTVVAYVVIGSAAKLPHAVWFAFAWNCYSVIDAYRYRSD
jgi:hypothetical protein